MVKESTFLKVFDRCWWPSGRARSWLGSILGGLAVGRLLAWSPSAPMDQQWLEEATALPRVGLDGAECTGKAVVALLGRDRLVVAVVNDDEHT